MQFARRASPVVALLLLASVATAYAECAWVLWDRGIVLGQPVPDPRPLAGWPDRRECEAERRARYAQSGAGEPPNPGVAIERRTRDTGRSGGERAMFIQFDCLPDTVDPRGPRGR